MPKKTNSNTPSDEEILLYDSVPVEIAAKYIGWSSCNIAYALQQERAPFGIAAKTSENPETGKSTWTYNISPGLLIAYKRGELEGWHLSALTAVIKTEIMDALEEQLARIVNTQIVAVFAGITGRRSA